MPFVQRNGKCIKSWSKTVELSYTNGKYTCHPQYFKEMENSIRIMLYDDNLRKPQKISFWEKFIPLYEWHIDMPSKIMCLREREIIL